MNSSEMDFIADCHDHDMMRLDGLDHCCVGVVERFGMGDIFCYDKRLVIEDLMKDGMTYEGRTNILNLISSVRGLAKVRRVL